MDDYEKIVAFIEFNYKPFDKIQCVKRLIFLWVFSIGAGTIGHNRTVWILIFVLINLFVSTIFIKLIFQTTSVEKSRFLCDGITCLYSSIILNIVSYKILMLRMEENWILLMLLLLLLGANIIVFSIVVCLNIKKDKYRVQPQNKKINSLALWGAWFGILAAKIFLQDMSQDSLITLLAILILILSFIVGIGSSNLLKVLLMKKIG